MLSRSKPWDGEDDPVSFIKRAQEAAAQAADVARARAQEAAAVANRTAADPATAETLAKSARDAVGMARRGVTTVIEKIDPSTLADLIIKATALQEMTNKALRKKGSPYRIAEISISASIPPAVSFAIGRIGDAEEEVLGDVVASSDLVDQASETRELVLALDGTTVDPLAVHPVAVADAESGALPPGSDSQG
jgi:hypothetical protein